MKSVLGMVGSVLVNLVLFGTVDFIARAAAQEARAGEVSITQVDSVETSCPVLSMEVGRAP